MYRLFVAIDLPEGVKDHLALLTGGLPGARWVAEDQYHLTLRFIGDVDGLVYDDVVSALDGIRHPPLTLQLSGVGHFPPKGMPKVLWAGITGNEALLDLRNSVERRLVRAGLEPERRKYHPHVTIARFRDVHKAKVARFLGAHGLFRTEPFEAHEMHLYRSYLHESGAVHEIVASFDLAP